ncbi:SurA N-terminal domain-containing protein [Kitasatospora nipponensis]|uniref:SurA N-terminal domain-containing protein n=1 Tax=Kitasatospora nipponensis TaxID=258049 RepID=A0ABN1WK98_9ACTN
MIRSSSVPRTARRTVRRSAPALGALLAVVVLSACGGQPRPGAAALVGDQRITVAAVQARVAEFRSQAAALPSGQYQEQSGLVGATVSGMVFNAVVEHALESNGLSVSQTEIAQVRAEQAQVWGGEPALEQMLLLKHAVPVAEIDGFYREQIGLQKLAALTGKQIGTTEGNKTVHQLLAEASAELKVSVNPRYGSWDAEQAVLDAPSADWLPQSGAAA